MGGFKIIFSHEDKDIGIFSNLHQCTFNIPLGMLIEHPLVAKVCQEATTGSVM